MMNQSISEFPNSNGKFLLMERPISKPIPAIDLPDQYSLINVSEENGYLWEAMMTQCFDEHKPGTFRGIVVANNYYDAGRVFALLDENDTPIATATSWQYDHWWDDTEHGQVIFVGVVPSHRGRKLGQLIVNYALHDIAKRGFTIAAVDVEVYNYPAIKTYIECGFTPQIAEVEDIWLWEEQYKVLSLPIPEYDHSLRPHRDLPHPPRPWPYQLKEAQKAAVNGDIYLFGIWDNYNMYLVDRAEYDKFRTLLINDGAEHFDFMYQNNVGQIFVDSPLNPSVLLLEKGNGTFILSGTSKDTRFINGINMYLNDCQEKYNDLRFFQD
jgi:ribosomal protein S18 acetylase RimI-like enzyme